MTKCKHCGFEPQDGPITSAEGSPCGYRGCTRLSCCYESWEDHMRNDHKVDPDSTTIEDVM